MDFHEIIKALTKPSPDQIWAKAHIVSIADELLQIRKDDFGNRIRLQDYGKRDSEYGWEFDHIYPVSAGAHNGLANLRPLHWRANLRKSDALPGLLGLAELLSHRKGSL